MFKIGYLFLVSIIIVLLLLLLIFFICEFIFFFCLVGGGVGCIKLLLIQREWFFYQIGFKRVKFQSLIFILVYLYICYPHYLIARGNAD